MFKDTSRFYCLSWQRALLPITAATNDPHPKKKTATIADATTTRAETAAPITVVTGSKRYLLNLIVSYPLWATSLVPT